MGTMTAHALADAGLVDVRAERHNRWYRARRKALGPLAPMLERMWDDVLSRLKLAAELEETRRGPRPKKIPPAKQPRARSLRTQKER